MNSLDPDSRTGDIKWKPVQLRARREGHEREDGKVGKATGSGLCVASWALQPAGQITELLSRKIKCWSA